MKQTFYGYDVYRGRSGLRTALTVIIIILLVLLILAVAAFFLIQPYVSYDDQGKAHLNLPFFDQAEPTPTPIQTQDVVVVTPDPIPGPVVAVLPLDALIDGTAEKLAAEAGATRALFDMKAQSGELSYVSQQAWALDTNVSAADPALNEAIQAMNQGDLYTVARLSCLKDDTVPYTHGKTSAFRVTGGNWKDSTHTRWFSPATQAARDYLSAICAEVAELGFDELLLDYATFPTQGKLSSIIVGDAYQDDPAFKAQALDGFYAAIRKALADYPDIKLSLVVEAEFLTGDPQDLSGLTPQLVAQYFDLLYLPIPQEDQDYTAVLEAIGFPEDRLIYFAGDGSQGSDTLPEKQE